MGVTTAAQRTALTRLRKSLAIDGYLIFSVSKYYRQTRYDFVAVHKSNPCHFFVVCPREGRILMRPFGPMAASAPAQLTINELTFFHDDPIHVGPQIAPSRKNLRLEHFVPPRQRREMRVLMGYPPEGHPQSRAT
jgi:hypothetical protein